MQHFEVPVLAAIVTAGGTIAAAFLALTGVLFAHSNSEKLAAIHVLVNSRLEIALQDLKTALSRIDHLEELLRLERNKEPEA